MSWSRRALALVIVAVWSVPIYLALAIGEDFFLGDRRFWLDLLYGGKRRLLYDVLTVALEAAPFLAGLGVAVFLAARLSERRQRSPALTGLIASIALGAGLGAFLSHTPISAVPALTLTAALLWLLEQFVSAVLARSPR
ncbi:MAG: hypothetical protein IT384_21070 [Deltaproteobacteria bacterium]|nr:hypothetical protein [Deltaproteobacteria bacterium]